MSDNYSCDASFKQKSTYNPEDFNGVYGNFETFYIEILHSNKKLFIREISDEIERVNFKLDNDNNIIFNNNLYAFFKCTSSGYPQKIGDVGLGYVKKLLYNNTQINLLFFNEKKKMVKKAGKYPETSFVKLTTEELKKYSAYELKIMRNEVFARNGHIFNSKGKVGKYFSNKKWYKPKKKITEDELTSIEKFNVLLIKKVEDLK